MPKAACLILGLPHLVSRPGESSVLDSRGGPWRRMVEASKVFRLAPGDPQATAPEIAWLGLVPAEWDIKPGPIAAASIGPEPPVGSVSFQATWMGIDTEGQLAPLLDLTDGDALEAAGLCRPLETRRLRLVSRGSSAALVWLDGEREFVCTPPQDAYGKRPTEVMPQGDRENEIRQFVDDSINLLMSSELNARRRGEGQIPIGVLWPWGPGLQQTMPNLPLRRGSVLRCYSNSTRLHGLCRMFGDWHCEPEVFGSGLKLNLSAFLPALKSSDPSLAICHPVPEMQRHERLDALNRLLAALEQSLLDLVLSHPDPVRLTVLAPSDPWELTSPASRVSPTGLGFNYDSRRIVSNSIPYDERILDDPSVPSYPLHEAAQRAAYIPTV